ncbi:MAG TPA: hypothetical protein PKX74_16255 [Leptospiraceae bacterium]|nr:hypothetical protein [Leptospiraceae bacterium]HMW58393.1 hypothetical protein [Leptospiraceae bacterium]HMY47032.1 hypothetical protein [Leptospiraceae bacterium]HMZ35234.1 hypothetical protein [Leptospiraceae bacterium]HNJ03513.1 hypothetical protein [Leptospiraceae bacterium]
MTHRLFCLQSLAAVCFLITFALHAQTPHAEEEKKSPGDPIAEKQSVDAFSSLEDGQPSAPGEFEMVTTVSSQNSRKALNDSSVGGELRFTPQGGTFLTNMELGLGLEQDARSYTMTSIWIGVTSWPLKQADLWRAALLCQQT